MSRNAWIPVIAAIVFAGTSRTASADGLGLGNLTYTQAEVGKSLSLIKNREGHGWVAMHRGYLVVIFSKDGGAGQGGIIIVDVSNPRGPKSVVILDNAATREVREPHAWGMRGDTACLQANYWINC